jgi:hypothetical protein
LTAECAGIDLDATAAKEQTINDEVQELRNRLMEAKSALLGLGSAARDDSGEVSF